jgi:hypothetical protein
MTEETTKEQEEALKELGLVVGTDEEALWQTVVTQTEKIIRDAENTVLINTAFLQLAKEKTKGIIRG